MSKWENTGISDEWYTPKYIFDALNCQFDLDVSSLYTAQRNGLGIVLEKNKRL